MVLEKIIMKIFSTILFVLMISQRISSTIRIGLINNAIFDPMNTSYILANLSNIKSFSSCICQCYTMGNCLIATYYGYRQQCILYSTLLQSQQLYIASSSENATVIIMNSTNYAMPITQTSNAFTTSYTNAVTTYQTTAAVTTTANISCGVSSGSIFSYTTTPTSYTQQMYNYTATYNGTAILEFAFKAQNTVKYWHIDDVSIVDATVSNVSVLVNGGFEFGNLTGWTVACSSENCGGSGGVIDTSSCHTGSYCYKGVCVRAYDFLRQSFQVVAGHIYSLTFWIVTVSNPSNAAYVDIYQA